MIINVASGVSGEFDRALNLAQSGDTIILASGGNYTTKGAWYFATRNYISVPAGVKIIATGATIKLSGATTTTGGVPRPDKDLPILWMGDGAEIVGGTWDADYASQGGWFAQGIRCFGKFTIKDCVIKGLSGSRASGTPSGQVESFAISSQENTGGSVVAGVTVKDCKVASASDYVSGIFIGSTIASTTQSIVANCSVDLGTYGQFAYSSNGPTLFSKCTGSAARFWYNDTGNSIGARIYACTGTAYYAALSSVATVAGINREIWADGCTFTTPKLVEWWDQSGTGMTGTVTVTNTTLSGTGTPTYYAAVANTKGAVQLLGCSLGSAIASVTGGSITPTVI